MTTKEIISTYEALIEHLEECNEYLTDQRMLDNNQELLEMLEDELMEFEVEEEKHLDLTE